MADYTETFSNSPSDTILGAEFQTEFAAIQTAIATKAAGNAFQNADGSTLDSLATAWARDAQATRTAGLTMAKVTLTPITTDGLGVATSHIAMDGALGNVFYQVVTWVGGADLVVVDNPTNFVTGQEAYLIIKRTGGTDQDQYGPLFSNGGNAFKYSSTSPGGTGRTCGGPTALNANQFNMYYIWYNGTYFYATEMTAAYGII